MMGYTAKDVEKMIAVLNYSIHHHVKDTKFADEDKVVLKELEDFLQGLLAEGRV